jgi:putative membrane protein
MIKYAAFSFVIFGELAVVQLFKIFTVTTRVRFKKGYILFFITLIVGIFIAPGGLTSEISNKKGVTLVTSSSIENIAEHSHDEKQRIEGDEIIFNEKNYIHYLEDLGNNLDKHIGKRIKITGFVLKQEGMARNEFIITRMLISCCAADSQVLGIVARWDKAETLSKDEWITVEGIVGSSDKHAVIQAAKVSKSQKPNNQYIYE